MSHFPSMKNTITLTDQEKNLCQLLLDVSTYIGDSGNGTKPELRFTGGWVRDKLLGISSKDIDVGISSMTGYKFGTLMKEYLDQAGNHDRYEQGTLGGLAKIEANPEKSKHLETVTTKILGLEVDLVNLRRETYVETSRNPMMEFGTPEEDALRRDATINALFYNLSTSEVEDLTGYGLQDMELRLIRTPLSPYQTFKDDPLRILRCIRFASKLDYVIDGAAKSSMSDAGIKDALRAKISRERVGIEIEKMLKGPRPLVALNLIDSLGLYNTIFTDTLDSHPRCADTTQWKTAYDQLSHILVAGSEQSDTSAVLWPIRSNLLTTEEDIFLAWMLCTLTPWVRVKRGPPTMPNAKLPPPVAVTVARESLKADNKVTKIMENAVVHMNEIITWKDSIPESFPTVGLPSKRRNESASRGALGMAMRRWGPYWRSSVMLALLVQVMEAEDDSARQVIIKCFAKFLSILQEQALLDSNQLKPLVDGNMLTKALGIKPGPWMKKALDIAMEWQLRTPDESNPDDGVAEVIRRKKELNLI